MVLVIRFPFASKGKNVLGSIPWPEVECGLKAIPALARILPVGDGRPRYCPGPGVSIGIQEELPCLSTLLIAGRLVASLCQAPRLNDFTGSPA